MVVLSDFLKDNRAELLVRAQAKVNSRSAPHATSQEVNDGVPLFLDQLIALLSNVSTSRESKLSMDATATLHGGALLKQGFTVAQVVHDYGDICQVVTELADETRAPITTDEFHTLNRCLDDAIAQAVTEFARVGTASRNEDDHSRAGELAHELRNHLSAAMLAFAILQKGQAAVGGSVGSVVLRNLKAASVLVDRSLVASRVFVGNVHPTQVSVAELLEEVEIEASMRANERALTLSVVPIPRAMTVEVDRQIVLGAISNIVQNALKFTHPGSKVTLRAAASADRVKIEIEDECGGLPGGKTEELFVAHQQLGKDTSGAGLGLMISRKAVEANRGTLTVRDLPGVGCVFTIELPASAVHQASPSLPD